jgi:hypothetical protein
MLVSLTIRDPSGHTLLAFTDQHPNLQPYQPNGPRCGPTCWGGAIRVR